MPKTRRIQTNFSKGELSPRLDGRADLAAYFEGVRTAENVVLLRQGGVTRRAGTRFIAEAKYPDTDVVLLPFEVDVDTAYTLEVGSGYIRVYKGKAQVQSGGNPVEIVTPYTESYLRKLHFTQSVDVLYLFQPYFHQRTLSRVSDTNWLLSPVVYNPPPSFEADVDISEGDPATAPPGGTPGGEPTPGGDVYVAIIAPLPGTISGDVPVTVSVRPGVSVQTVRVSKNGVPFGPVMTTFPYTFIWGTNQEPDFSAYTLTALVTDSLGNEVTSAGVIVTIDHNYPWNPGGGGGGGGAGDGGGGGGAE